MISALPCASQSSRISRYDSILLNDGTFMCIFCTMNRKLAHFWRNVSYCIHMYISVEHTYPTTYLYVVRLRLNVNRPLVIRYSRNECGFSRGSSRISLFHGRFVLDGGGLCRARVTIRKSWNRPRLARHLIPIWLLKLILNDELFTS